MRGTPPLVLGLGEILWDCFEDGRRPGGAPANVAFHVNQLGASGMVCSRVGSDSDGDGLVTYLNENGLDTASIQRDPKHPTGRAQIVRDSPHEQHFEITAEVAWDYLEFDAQLRGVCAQADAICFGTLAQRSETARQTIHQCLEVATSNCLLVYDVNLRPPWFERSTIERSLHAADVAKFNLDEIKQLAIMLKVDAAEPQAIASALQQVFSVERICITRGDKGCLLIDRHDQCDVPGIPLKLVDTVGAGDAFTAAMIVGDLHGWPLRRIAEFANQVAACVARQVGAMAPIDDELVQKASWRSS